MPGLSYFRKSLFLLFFWWVETGLVQAQELLWEKRIPLSNYEFFSCVTECSDGGYLAFGSSERWVKFNPWSIGAMLMKFDQNGDTLWTKWTGKYGGFNKVIRGEDGLLYALMGYRDLQTNEAVWSIYVVTEDGVPIVEIPLNPGPGTTLTDMELRNGSFWLSGERMPSIFHSSGLSFDFLLMKVRPDGSESFSFRFNGNDPTSRGRNIEFMPNGNILFSGSCGRNISAFEIDTAGNQIGFRNYFQNPVNGGWQNASVKQMAGNQFLVSGSRSTSPYSYYLGKHDSTGQRIWGGIAVGGTGLPMVFTDASIVYHYGNSTPPTSIIRRISTDSGSLSSLNFMGPGTIPDYKDLMDIYHESDSSGMAVGTIYPTNFSSQNLYIAKFGGLGIPFNPTSTEDLKNPKAEAPPVPFPNPGTDRLRFTQVSGPGKLSFTDMQGRKVWEGSYVPEQGINTQRFRPGLYAYRLECNGKVWMGKWVKEAP